MKNGTPQGYRGTCACQRSEEACGAGWALDPKVLEAAVGQDPAAWRPLDEALLQQVGLVDVLDRVRLLVDRGRQGRKADRPARELTPDRIEDRAVVAVEARLVDLEHAEALLRHVARDYAGAPHVGVVADPLQEAVSHPGRPPRPLGDGPLTR